MGRGCAEESPEGATTLEGDLLMEENGKWRVALKAALAPQLLRPGETGGPPKGRQRGAKAIQRLPPTNGGPKKPGPAAGKGKVAPTGAGAPHWEETSPP